ncbi:MAG: ribonuclease T [Gammaproteobacteria bacterium]|nr:ribonuclease T [Gammaproteobacteria bacterium]|tara:strand:+ start:3559 stop:4158 length:600 start_codon:yes stop_codon:yes gene_type:complete
MDMSSRFRGFLPVVVDLETGGFDPATNPILEIAAVQVRFEGRTLQPAEGWRRAVHPYPGGVCNPAALKVTGIDPMDPNRQALGEGEALRQLFRYVRTAIKQTGCHRAILVAHNAAFDQQFLNRAVERTQVKRNPFHPFSFIDTASLAAVAFGHTVLSEACARADIAFDRDKAHDALYDAERTAELFCAVVNAWEGRGPL